MADADRALAADVTYDDILVPTDGSEGAWRGARHAIDLAKKYDARIHVLHVVDEHTAAETPALSSDELHLEKLEADAHELMSDVVSEAESHGLTAVTSCTRGVPHDEIFQYVDDHDIDLVVIGLHGSGGARRPHVGSTTERVLEGSRVPVVPV